MSAIAVPGGCVVPLKEPAGIGACNWPTNGPHLVCHAHRKRHQLHGDYLAHVPVVRKPPRSTEAARQRHAAGALAKRDREFVVSRRAALI